MQLENVFSFVYRWRGGKRGEERKKERKERKKEKKERKKERKNEREKEQRKSCIQQQFKDYLAVKMFKNFQVSRCVVLHAG